MSCKNKFYNAQPEYLVQVPIEIRKLILWRYLNATGLCACLQFLTIQMFLYLALLNVTHPLSMLKNVLQFSLLSPIYWVLTIPLLLGVGVFGLLNFHITLRRHFYYATHIDRILGELPQSLALLGTVVFVGFYLSWFCCFTIRRHLPDWSSIGFIPFYAGFCTFYNFMTAHRRKHIFSKINLSGSLQLALWQYDSLPPYDQFQRTLYFGLCHIFYSGCQHGCVMQGTLYVLGMCLRQPNMLFHAWCLGELVVYNLYMIRFIYCLVLNHPLPLVVLPRQRKKSKEMFLYLVFWKQLQRWLCQIGIIIQMPLGLDPELVITDALQNNFLYGFHLHSAKDFYEVMACSSNQQCVEIFKIRNPKYNWVGIRNVVFNMIDNFVDTMQACLSDPCLKRQPIGEQLFKLKQPGMRNLLTPKPIRMFSLWNLHLKQVCESQKLEYHCGSPKYKLNRLRQRLIGGMCNAWDRLYIAVLDSLPHVKPIFEIDRCNRLKYELQYAEPLVWAMQGLVCICVRSLKEDCYGIVGPDLEHVLDKLISMHHQLLKARETLLSHCDGNIEEVQAKPSCGHEVLWNATLGCLQKILWTFEPYLSHIMVQKKLEIVEWVQKFS